MGDVLSWGVLIFGEGQGHIPIIPFLIIRLTTVLTEGGGAAIAPNVR